MVSLMIFFAAIMALPIFISSIWNRRAEESLPISCFSIVVTIYIFGFAGKLKAGAYAVLIASALLYFISLGFVIFKKKFGVALKNIVTPGIVAFALFFAFAVYTNIGRFPSAWDEFSHWAFSVKDMYAINDFGTSAQSASAFPSYPPAMEVFQYFLQVINGFTAPFSDWKLYLAYQVFAMALVAPFTQKLSFKKPVQWGLTSIVLMVCPMVFFAQFYHNLYIDGFLGLLFGCVMGYIFINSHKNAVMNLTIIFGVFVLVLTKDLGVALAAVAVLSIFVLTIYRFIKDKRGYTSDKKGIIGEAIFCLSGLIALFAAKYSWNWLIIKNGTARIFSDKVDLIDFFKVIFLGADPNKFYVFRNYFANFVLTQFEMGAFSAVYLLIFSVLCLALLLFLMRAIKEKDFKLGFLSSILVFTMGLYCFAMSIIYMYKFTYYEGSHVASMGRYLGIVFSAALVFVVITIIWKEITFLKFQHPQTVAVIALLLFISIPINETISLVSRKSVHDGISEIAPYVQLVEKTKNEMVKQDATYTVIAQESTGYDRWALKYYLYPNKMSGTPYSIGPEFYGGDIWSTNVSATEWTAILKAQNCDYLILIKVNDYFMETYSECFAPGSPIVENSIYSFDAESGLFTYLDLE